MIVCSSNAWGGCLPDYVPYIVNLANTVDVFCLQEVHMASTDNVPERIMPIDSRSRTVPLNLHLYNQLLAELGKEFVCTFSPQMTGFLHDCESTELNVAYGNALFVRRSVKVLNFHDTHVYQQGPVENNGVTAAHKTAQAVIFEKSERRVLISHTHGLWWNSNKGNVFPRSMQFKNWYTWLEKLCKDYHCTDVMLCGDFNQTRDTDVITQIPHWSVFGTVPGRDLIKSHNILSTRTSHYQKELREADYMFVSPSLKPSLLIDYDVPSDHALLQCTLEALR
jgi:hypothetical protein